ncbi:uncharacterized protein IL334_005068 [Kwoniella shivajii]|uniref:Uncharacterized protein n=1 Tax=Kwoniella shivajii TaxID=564305 RepID=A0ABZ1D245_9TREE|nr:hypothetical protein IL334_005068 [Kwoniella shivajii]
MSRPTRERKPASIYGNMTSSDQPYGSDDEDYGETPEIDNGSESGSQGYGGFAGENEDEEEDEEQVEGKGSDDDDDDDEQERLKRPIRNRPAKQVKSGHASNSKVKPASTTSSSKGKTVIKAKEVKKNIKLIQLKPAVTKKSKQTVDSDEEEENDSREDDDKNADDDSEGKAEQKKPSQSSGTKKVEDKKQASATKAKVQKKITSSTKKAASPESSDNEKQSEAEDEEDEDALSDTEKQSKLSKNIAKAEITPADNPTKKGKTPSVKKASAPPKNKSAELKKPANKAHANKIVLAPASGSSSANSTTGNKKGKFTGLAPKNSSVAPSSSSSFAKPDTANKGKSAVTKKQNSGEDEVESVEQERRKAKVLVTKKGKGLVSKPAAPKKAAAVETNKAEVRNKSKQVDEDVKEKDNDEGVEDEKELDTAESSSSVVPDGPTAKPRDNSQSKSSKEVNKRPRANSPVRSEKGPNSKICSTAKIDSPATVYEGESDISAHTVKRKEPAKTKNLDQLSSEDEANQKEREVLDQVVLGEVGPKGSPASTKTVDRHSGAMEVDIPDLNNETQPFLASEKPGKNEELVLIQGSYPTPVTPPKRKASDTPSTPCPSPKRPSPGQKIDNVLRGSIMSSLLSSNFLKTLKFNAIETPTFTSAKISRHWREVLGPELQKLFAGAPPEKGKAKMEKWVRLGMWDVVQKNYDKLDWKSLEHQSGICTTKLKRHFREIIVKEGVKHIESC